MKKLLFFLTTRYGIWVLAFLALVIAPAAILYFMEDLRERFWTYLGYGYLPVGMWLAAFVATLIFAGKASGITPTIGSAPPCS